MIPVLPGREQFFHFLILSNQHGFLVCLPETKRKTFVLYHKNDLLVRYKTIIYAIISKTDLVNTLSIQIYLNISRTGGNEPDI